MKNRVFLYLFFMLVFVGCQKSESMEDFDALFTHKKSVFVKDCLSEELIMGRPFYMIYADSSVIFYDDLGDSLFTMVDLSDNKRIYRFGERGQGSRDFLQVASLQKDKTDSCVCVYDYYKHSLIRINLENVKKGLPYYTKITSDTINSIDMILSKYNNTFVGLGFYEKSMFALIEGGSDEKYFYEYPYRDDKERKIDNCLRGMAYQGMLRSKPSLDKFVYAINFAPIFMLCSVEPEAIVRTYQWVGGYPIYRAEENEKYRTAPMSAENKMGFISAYATDRYVYLLYSDRTLNEYKEKAFMGNVIYQIDWDGNPVSKYETDLPLSQICVSNSDDMVYAIANREENLLVEFALSGGNE